MHANDYPLPMPAETWRDRAACAGHETAVFYPTKHRPSAEPALKICRACPVQVDCLTAVLAEEAAAPDTRPFGVRGGTTAIERVRMRRRNRMGLR